MKRQYMLPLVLVILASFSLLAGCSKDEDNPASGNKTRAELLTSKTWELKAATSMGVNVSSIVEMYMRKLKFNTDGTVKVEGTAGSATSTWVLASNDTKIILDQGTDDEFAVTIVSLSESEFKAKADFSDGTTTYPVDLTYR